MDICYFFTIHNDHHIVQEIRKNKNAMKHYFIKELKKIIKAINIVIYIYY